MRVSISEDRCVAAGQCVAAAPDVFDQRDDDGVVVLINPEPSEDQADEVEHARSVCPAQAIFVEASVHQND